MARTSTTTGPRRTAQSPWPTRREREGGVARPVAAGTDRIAAVGPVRAAGPPPRHALIPEQRSAPPAPTPPPAPAARPGAVPRVQVRSARDRSDAVTEALLATVPPFGTPPFGTRGASAGLPHQHGAARARTATNRRRLGIAVGLFVLGAGIAGLVILVRSTGALGGYLEDLGARVTSVAPAGADTTTPAAGPGYTFRLAGGTPGATVMWSVDGTSGGDQAARLPWDRTISGEQNGVGSATLTAYTNPGSGGDLTCTIVGSDGRVLDTRTATSTGGAAGSAAVTCSALG